MHRFEEVLSHARRRGGIFLIIVVVSVLPSCAQQTGSLNTIPTARATQLSRGSWIDPDVSRSKLLYVSSDATASVYVYLYHGGALKGELTGFSSPQGLCVDRAGDIFVPDTDDFKIFEYPHGSAKLLAVLQDESHSYPVDCAIDPVTGDLAVSNVQGSDVIIFRKARGRFRRYYNSNFFQPSGVGYDDQGDLFVVGLNQQLRPFVAELARGKQSSGFVFVSVPGLRDKIRTPWGIKWDGRFIVIGDESSGDVYQIKVRGSAGRIVGSLYLAISPGSFWIPRPWHARSGHQGTRIIAVGGYQVKIFRYPAGGEPIRTIDVGDPLGVAVSPSQS